MTRRFPAWTTVLLVSALLAAAAGCGKPATTQPDEAAPNAPAAKQPAEAPSAEQVQPAAEKTPEPAEKTAPEEKPQEPPPGTRPIAILHTKLGDIEIKFFPEKAPKTVTNFLELCKSGFYDGTRFHRCIPGFMIQGGDPNTRMGPPSTWGQGGHTDASGKEINVPAEFNDIHHGRGIVSMARAADPNSASSQFFICVADAGALDHQYTAFGKVIKGMSVADKIAKAPKVGPPQDPEGSRPRSPVVIEGARVEYRPLPGAGTGH